MFNYLLETKNEYTDHLSNIITPFIYEGFKKMYNDIAFPKTLPQHQKLGKDEILNFYQKCLKLCKDWDKSIINNTTIIDIETNRILNGTSMYGYLPDLIKACIKSHLVVLMYNPTCNNQVNIDPEHYQNIKISHFIHIIYIEFAKELWCNPYLMYHDYSPIEIKKNQRECILLIKDCIKEGIKKLLPIKQILYNYLREDNNNNNNNNNNNIINQVSMPNKESILKNINNIINNPISTVDENNIINNPVKNPINNNKLSAIISDLETSEFDNDKISISNEISDSDNNNNKNKNYNEISDDDSDKNNNSDSDIEISNNNNKELDNNDKKTNDDKKKSNDKELDEKLKALIFNDLNPKELSDTSINNNFQEIFSNSNK